MRVVYDLETDTLCLLFREGPVAESDEIREGIIIDYDREGRVVSLEILKASEHVSDPKAIAYELKSAKAAPL